MSNSFRTCMRAVGISSKNTLQQIVNNSHSHRETSNSFCLSNSCYRKTSLSCTRRHIWNRCYTCTWNYRWRCRLRWKDCSQLFHIFVFRFVQFCPTSCLATAIVSSTLLRCWTIKPYCCFQLCNWFMTLTESTLQSTFLEYFCAISTIEKYFY